MQRAANGPAKRQLTGDFLWAASGPLRIPNSYGPLMALEFLEKHLVFLYKLQNPVFFIETMAFLFFTFRFSVVATL